MFTLLVKLVLHPVCVSFPVFCSIARYLEQSILALDVSNEVTKSHMPPVLSSLSQHLARMEKTLESGTGTTGLARQVKRLRMVTEHLCQPHGR